MVLPITSKVHHWWPVTLQKYWADNNGDISWVKPDDATEKKRVKRRKVGKAFHGHTILRGNLWEYNFEEAFSGTDSSIPATIATLDTYKPFGPTEKKVPEISIPPQKNNWAFEGAYNFYRLDEETHRCLLALIYSLLIRSPAKRSVYENYAAVDGMKPCEEVGKGNMLDDWMIAKDMCENGSIWGQFFILIFSPSAQFIYGDGNLDWLTSSLVSSLKGGRALLPLTPNLCVYFCTPMHTRPAPNCAALCAKPELVERINDIVQIYSGKQLFFRGQRPVLIDAFKSGEFRAIKNGSSGLIDSLDDIAGNKRFTFGDDYFSFDNWEN